MKAPAPYEDTYFTGRLHEAYEKGYDQAIQDFMKKACEWLSKNARLYYSAYATTDKLTDDFKEAMEE